MVPASQTYRTRPQPLVLREADYRPIDGYPFQRWGERTGPPFVDIRPLTSAAAARVWRRTVELNGHGWDDALPPDAFPEQSVLDLRDAALAWDRQVVRDWLLGRQPDRDVRVLACYGPEWAVELAWGAFCDHWLTFLWVDACAWPVCESWLLRFANERLTFGRTAG